MRRLLSYVAAFLTACGGGGGDGSTSASSPQPPPSATHSIAGTVTAPNGAPLSGVQLSLSGAASSATVANANGGYSFVGLANGSYVVTPSAAGAAFSPASMAVTLQGQSASAINFARTSQSYASTQQIADAMVILHAQMLSAFATADRAALNSLGVGSAYLRTSGRAYVDLVQVFVNDSLAFTSLKSQTMAIDWGAVAALFSTYGSQDSAYADTFYRDTAARLRLSNAVADAVLADVIPQVNNIYALALLQLP
jgi:Carboxypeptidase regulatory-like domain